MNVPASAAAQAVLQGRALEVSTFAQWREAARGLLRAGAPRFVAWFEPRHDVLPQVAEHFISRMGKVSWMIATPDASVLWDGTTLHNCGPLMSSAADLDDSGEALWLTYYRSIFNPARLNTSVMQSHIPSRFWKNLPEGALVPSLVSQAGLGARRIGLTAAPPFRSRPRTPSPNASSRPSWTNAAAASCGSTPPRRSAGRGRSAPRS